MNQARIKRSLWFWLSVRLLHRKDAHTIVEWQMRRARIIASYAMRHVPLYSALFGEKGLNLSQIRRMSNLQSLPIISKQVFLHCPMEHYIDNSSPLQTKPSSTSGSSGQPFFVVSNPELRRPKWILFSRYSRLYPLSRFIPSLLDARRIVYIDARGTTHGKTLFYKMTDFHSDPTRAIAIIATFAPHVLASFPTVLLQMARVLRSDSSMTRPKPQYVVSYGEMLSSDARCEIQDVFKCPVFDRYAMAEFCSSIGIECAYHEGIHVNCEYFIVEIVDREGKSVAPGQSGRVIITDLWNTTMPFIRYDTGDAGVIVPGMCACGLKTPRIRLVGRYSANLRFGDKIIHHLEFDLALDTFMHIIAQYQVVKLSETHAAIRIIPGGAFSLDDESRIRESVQRVTGSEVHVSVEVVDELIRVSRGKSKIVVDLSGTNES